MSLTNGQGLFTSEEPRQSTSLSCPPKTSIISRIVNYSRRLRLSTIGTSTEIRSVRMDADRYSNVIEELLCPVNHIYELHGGNIPER